MHSSLFRQHFFGKYSSLTSSLDSSDSSCPSTPPLSASWAQPPQIDLVVMNDEHRKEVFDLVVDTFFRDEPLNKCLEFDIPDEPVEFTELIVYLALQDKCSFVAIDTQTQKVVGVVLNIIRHEESDINDENVDKLRVGNFQSEKLRYIFHVIHHVHLKINLFTELKADRLLHTVIIAIDAHYRGLRLTEKLIQASITRAKNDLNLQGAFAEATSLFSSKAFRKQGYQIYDEIIYAKHDFIRLASLPEEHDRCQLVARTL